MEKEAAAARQRKKARAQLWHIVGTRVPPRAHERVTGKALVGISNRGWRNEREKERARERERERERTRVRERMSR